MRRTKHGKRRRGSFLVELAITFPIFISLLGMIIEISLMLWLKNHLVWVAHDACRDAVVYKKGFSRGDSYLFISEWLAEVELGMFTQGSKAPSFDAHFCRPPGQQQEYLQLIVSARYRPALPLGDRM